MKSKQITHSTKQNKKTLKKSYSQWKEKVYNVNDEYITMSKRKNARLVNQSFIVRPDRDVFPNIMIPNIPIIEM